MKELHLFEILGRKVVDADGKYAGRLEDIEAERGDDVCPISNYLVVHRSLLDRVTTWALAQPVQRVIPIPDKARPYRVPWDKMDLSDPQHPRITVPQSELSRVRAPIQD